MDNRRLILYTALAFIIFSLWSTWQHDYPSVNTKATQSSASSDNDILPVIAQKANSNDGVAAETSPKHSISGHTISVKTDVLSLNIDTEHGDIINAWLLDYPVKVDKPTEPIQLLYDKQNQQYIAKSNLFTSDGKSVKTLDLNYTSEFSDYQLQKDNNQLVLTLQGKTSDGLTVKKLFTFTRGSYLIQVNYQLVNTGETTWQGYMNNQLVQSSPPEDNSSMFHIGSYIGASYSNPSQHRYQKLSFKEMGKTNLNVETNDGWIAMQQHYFLTAWVLQPSTKNTLYSRSLNAEYTIGAVSQPLNLLPGKEVNASAKLYLGPEVTSTLKSIAPGLELTVDYGWLWFLSSLLFTLLKSIYSLVGNWGWSIVLLTMLIKLVFYRLSATSYKSMAGMRKLQPKLQALRERYGDDKAKISQGTMELYRQEKVNPLGGCLPILIQIPVFIALYWVLLESVELRQAPFILWIKDLAEADPLHILPIIMGVTMLIQQKLNPAPPDPMQAKIMMLLPVVFTALFWSFPSGLVLYWIVNNTLSILQQWHITRKYSDEPKKEKKQLSTVKS